LKGFFVGKAGLTVLGLEVIAEAGEVKTEATEALVVSVVASSGFGLDGVVVLKKEVILASAFVFLAEVEAVSAAFRLREPLILEGCIPGSIV